MPLREGNFLPMETLTKAERLAGDREFQAYWYRHFAPYCVGLSVLDAGAGPGYGEKIMRAAGAASVESFDLLSFVPWVKQARIEDYDDESHDVVLAMDVIEHVPDDLGFLSNLLRVARKAVMLSTPNWLFFHATNPHHFREYTPAELMELIGKFHPKSVEYWTANAECTIAPSGLSLPLDSGCCNFGVLIRKT